MAVAARYAPTWGAEGSTNLITAEGFGLRVSRRYWGVAPVVGLEVALAPPLESAG